MLKKYLQFIKENIQEIESEHHSLGEWVEDLAIRNNEILELIKPYLENSNPTVRISNTINVLDKPAKSSIYKIVTDYLNDTGKKTSIRTFVDLTNEDFILESEATELKAGKNVFTTFLKIITSLGLKDTPAKWTDIPDDFILFFEYPVKHEDVSNRMSRFPSLSKFIDRIPEDPKLFYGIKTDMTFHFGFKNGNLTSIGQFKINKAALNSLQLLDSPSAAHLKRELAYLSNDKIKFMTQIYNHMHNFHPGNTDNRSYKIIDGLMEFGYQGLGSWNDGKMANFDELKEKFREYLQKLKGHDKLKMAVRTDNGFWIYCTIMIK